MLGEGGGGLRAAAGNRWRQQQTRPQEALSEDPRSVTGTHLAGANSPIHTFSSLVLLVLSLAAPTLPAAEEARYLALGLLDMSEQEKLEAVERPLNEPSASENRTLLELLSQRDRFLRVSAAEKVGTVRPLVGMAGFRVRG